MPKYVEPGLEALGFSEPRWHAEFVDLRAADPADPACRVSDTWPSRNPGFWEGRAAEKIDMSVSQVTFSSGDMLNYWRHSLQERR